MFIKMASTAVEYIVGTHDDSLSLAERRPEAAGSKTFGEDRVRIPNRERIVDSTEGWSWAQEQSDRVGELSSNANRSSSRYTDRSSKRQQHQPLHHDLTDELARKLVDARRQLQQQKIQMDDMAQEIATLTEERELISQEARKQGEKITRSNTDLQALTHDLLAQLEKSRSHEHSLEKQLRRRERESKIPAEHSSSRISKLSRTRTVSINGELPLVNKVVSLVETLNSDILQTAVFIANSFAFQKVRSDPRGERKSAYERVKGDLGPRMPIILAATQHSDDPVLVRLAVQSCFAWYCKQIIGAWCFNEKMMSDQFLSRLYESIREEGKS